MPKYTDLGGGVFLEKGFNPKPKHLSDEAYADAVSSFPYHCCDVIPYQRKNGQVYICLANRDTDPARDEWWVFGGRVGMGEQLINAAMRHFEADTGLKICEDRLTRLFGEPQRYLWSMGPKDVEGKDVSMDVFADTFAFQITDEEIDIAQANLHPREYHRDQGIRLFGPEIFEMDVHPAMKRIYKEVVSLFGKR